MPVDSTIQLQDAELTTNLNYLQPTGFKILIDRTRYPNLEFFAQSVTHPTVGVNPVALPGRRVTSVPLAGDKVTYGDLTITVICDENMSAYKEMLTYLERIVNEGQVSSGERGTKIPTYADISIAVLSSHNNTSVQLRYLDCVPTDLGGINLTSSGEGAVITFDVSFRFSRLEVL
jgi:hypothetical protein|tara:strand:+ start:2205 stop:2729 length:525 start_codon:yes stop_codon:yes gene_type:complete